MPGMRLIAGSGRSGTTWVLDALASANNLRPVFEPLHPYVSETGSRYAHRALAADDDHPELREFLNDVSSGRRNRLWTQYRQRDRWLFPAAAEFRSPGVAIRLCRNWGKFLKEMPKLAVAARREDPLIKCIRANLMLGLLVRRYDCRSVLIVRHPGAVIESELRGAWTAKFALDRFRGDSRLHELTANRYRALLDRGLTPIEELALRWVIENQWVIDLAPANGVTVVFYERLQSSPDVEWQRIRLALDLASAPAASLLARPSQQSSPKRSSATARPSDNPLWMRVLSRDQCALIQGVLDEVQFDLYSMNEPQPREKTAQAVSHSAGGTSR